ncbi:MAG: radical SAM protein [Deltaproteobacteria bacterium]|nr:radical SAM protein [Deltaproteobacteria bacterium]
MKFIDLADGKHIPKEKADLALLSTSIVDCKHELMVVKALKERGYYVGVYGTFVSAVPEFFAESVDFIIRGEPESGALNLIAGNKRPQGIVNVSPVKNLDALPYPDWSQSPIHKFSYFPALHTRPALVMLTSRGCPHSCSYYCPYPINSGKDWRSRSVENVIGEMEYLKKDYGVGGIHFRDPIFTLDQERIHTFAEELIHKRLDIPWSCETRVDCLEKGLLRKMRKAGLRHLNMGIESSNGGILKKNGRLPAKFAHQEEIISFCHKMGITVAAFYILGLPGDAEQTIKQTIDYAKRLNTLVAQFGISTPYPGTPFFDQLQNEKRITSWDWDQYDSFTPVFKHPTLTHDHLLFLKESAFVSYYFRIPYLFRHLPLLFWKKFQ